MPYDDSACNADMSGGFSGGDEDGDDSNNEELVIRAFVRHGIDDN